jgi:antirestriction protein ArdC
MRTSDLFESVTRHIATAIESGAGTFIMPWHRWGENLAMPLNAASGRAYRGINTLLLWAAAEAGGYSSGRWATYRQWAAAGAQVRKGEKASPVLFCKTASNNDSPEEEGEDNRRLGPRFIARVYSLFNADQVEGAEAPQPKSTLTPSERVAAAEDFVCATGANIRHGGDRACYVSNIDQIWMPRFEQFRDAASYYSVLAHECVHWTGAKHRLDRDLAGRFGGDAYAMEELVAELGSAFVAAHLGLTVEPRADHAAYIASWLRVLRGDARAILTASAKAQQAVDYLIACSANDHTRSGPELSDDRLCMFREAKRVGGPSAQPFPIACERERDLRAADLPGKAFDFRAVGLEG